MTMLDETQAQSEEDDNLSSSEHDSHDNLSDAVESTPNAGSSAKPSSPKVLNLSGIVVLKNSLIFNHADDNDLPTFANTLFIILLTDINTSCILLKNPVIVSFK